MSKGDAVKRAGTPKGPSDSSSSDQLDLGARSEIAAQMEELTNELVTAYDGLIALRSKLVEVLSVRCARQCEDKGVAGHDGGCPP